MGWAQQGDPPWSVVNGVINAKGGGAKTYLIWSEPIADAEIDVKYRLSSANANSGIQVRSRCLDSTQALPTCGGTYEVCGPQLDVGSAYSGRLYGECGAFLQFGGQNIDNCRRTLKIGSWTTATARVEGAKVQVWLNGTFCLEYTLTAAEELKPGIFAIQSHPPFDLIEWQYIRMRKLNTAGGTRPGRAGSDPGAGEGNIAVSGSRIAYTIPARGGYVVRLLDVKGAIADRASGFGPVAAGQLTLPRFGIFFLEIDAPGMHTLRRIAPL